MLEQIEKEQNLVRRLERISLRRSLVIVRFHDDIRFYKPNQIVDATVIHVGTQKPDPNEFLIAFGSFDEGEEWKEKRERKQSINIYDVVAVSLDQHIAQIMEYIVDDELLHVVPRMNIVLTKETKR